MILKNARLITPGGIREGEIVVEAGKISSIGERSGARGIDLGGNFIAPGFIDLHVHGGNGRDAMEATGEAFRAIADFHASGGTTSLLLTTVTAPFPEIFAVLEAVRENRKSLAQVVGVHLEGPFISPVRAGAQRAEFIRDATVEEVDALLEYSDVLKRVTLAPERPGALEFIEKLHAKKISVSGGHSDAWDEEAQRAFQRGLRSTTHTFNCMSSARRRDGVRAAGLLEVALSEPEISCELVADGRHVSPTLMKMLYRAKGPAGICLVTDATAGAGLPNESIFGLGNQECVVREGACWLRDGSALAGSAARMIDLVRTMVEQVGVTLPEAAAMAAANPARALGLDTKGTLAEGNDADFVVFTPEWRVCRTYAGGAEVFSGWPREG